MTAPEWAQERQIMYQPTAVWLCTEYSGDRWLTDQFVLLNVTGAAWLKAPDDPESGDLGADWGDGAYKLTVSKGLQPRDSVPEPDIEAWFENAARCTWRPARPSDWSVAEHPGKAMLWTCEGKPCLVGESTWTAVKRHYEGVVAEYAAEGNLFRFRESTAEVRGNLRVVDAGAPFCYAAGIRIPDGQEWAASTLASALDSTSNEPLSLGS